ncbi:MULTISPECIES: transposase [unclassified Pseudomonas]|uniref:transposase n=1 Tax=unclassified Pseudomonas TaxID=196821 RepID=UPI002114AE65|nr:MULTISPECIES: transposase [unclassified Pseudomonas]
MIIYPKQLSLPLHDGYKLDTISPLMRTRLDSGRSRQRRKFTSVPTEVSVKWIFNDNQASFFEAWFARTLGDGALWFEATLKTPLGLKDYVCRFTDIYDGPELIGVDHWAYSATLELRDRPLMAPGWENFPELWFGKNIIDMAINREWPLSPYQTHMGAFDSGVNKEWPEP